MQTRLLASWPFAKQTEIIDTGFVDFESCLIEFCVFSGAGASYIAPHSNPEAGYAAGNPYPLNYGMNPVSFAVLRICLFMDSVHICRIYILILVKHISFNEVKTLILHLMFLISIPVTRWPRRLCSIWKWTCCLGRVRHASISRAKID